MATQLADDGAQADNDTGDAGNAAPQLTEVEQLASEMGWKPQSEYTGAEGKWKPAKDFVLVGHEITKGLKDTVKGLKDTVDRLASTATRQTERALRQQSEEINARFEKAVEDGDKAAAAAATKEMRQLEKSAAQDDETADVSFARENAWYGSNKEATAYAISVSQMEAADGKSVPQQLEAVKVAVRKRFPELFEGEAKPAPKPQPGVNAPTSRAIGQKRSTTFADLPAEAKQAGDRYAKLFNQKFGIAIEKAQADYAKDYFANRGDA